MISANMKAFLDMIANSEGTAGKGDDGYNVVVGGALFIDYSKHPNIKVFIKRINDYSTAAGRYQLLYRYWETYRKQLGLDKCKDGAFGKTAQDLIAIQQIKECRAIDDIENGRFDAAVKKCSRIWASLPGAGYGQHENTIETLKTAYINAGGSIAV